MNFIDFYCGAGGFSLGFVKAGFDHVIGIDNWDLACKIYKKNIGRVANMYVRRFKFDKKTMTRLNLPPKIDIMIGSPPCTSFSSANTQSRSKDLELTNEFLRLVEEIKPKAWIMENVTAIFDYVKAPFKYKFNMADYGLLQKRRRCFASGMPIYIDKPRCKWLTKTQEEELRNFRPEAIHRPYQTVTCRYNSFSHTTPHIEYNGKLRVINHEEALALQTFPFYYDIPSELSQRDREMLIGNAVPPTFSFKVAKAIKRHIEHGTLESYI